MEVYTFKKSKWAKFKCVGPMPIALQMLNTYIYDVFTKFGIVPEEGYKLIRFGEKTEDIEEEYNEQGYALFGEDFFPLRSIQLPSDL